MLLWWGRPFVGGEDLLKRLPKLAETPGWHFQDGIVIHVARNAKAFRSPKARYDPKEFSLRSSYGRFDRANGCSEWRVLEENVDFLNLQASSTGLIGQHADVLVTFFQKPTESPSHANKRIGSTEDEQIGMDVDS